MNLFFENDIKNNRFFNFTVNNDSSLISRTGSLSLKKHKFLFGCNGFGLIDGILNDKNKGIYKKHFLEVFNSATLPFYWGRYEREEGGTREEKFKKAAAWCVSKGLTLKGHPLCWHTVCADWLLKYDTPNIYLKQMDRIEREVGNFKGLIDMWDVINEVVILPEFDRYDNAVSRLAKQYGAEELTISCFKKAKESNPESILLLNDFNLTSKYEELIGRLLDKGCPIDVIGIQTHQHQGYLGVEYVHDVLERFSKFGLPLHFTEMTLLSGDLAPSCYDDLNDAARDEWPSTGNGEIRQAEQIREIYSQLYANPLVESIVWWDLHDGNWLNAPSGLLRRDYSVKPGFNMLNKLINEDWGFPEQTVTFNSAGQLEFTGPEGEYSLLIDGKVKVFTLNKESREITI